MNTAQSISFLVGFALVSCDRFESRNSEIEALRKETEALKQAIADSKNEQLQKEVEALKESLAAKNAPSSLVPSPLDGPDPAPPQANATSAEKPQPRIAPDGVFYLTQRASMMTDAGIAGLPPGTQVRRISQDAKGIEIQAANGLKMFVSEDKLTNDLDIAERIAADYENAQRAGALARAEEAKLVAAKQLQANKEQKDKEEAERKQKLKQSTPYVPAYRPANSLQRIGGGGN